MEIRKLTENDREACRKLSRYAFQTSENSYEDLKYPFDSVPMDWYFGAFDGNLLIACAGAIPFDIKLRSQDFKMSGVMGVATKPEYRNRRIIRDIMVKMFKDMHDNNIPISVLYPFKVYFYEMLGYKLVDERIFYHFKISDIICKETDYCMKEVERINDDIRKVYDEAILNFDYIAKRSEISFWRDFFKENYKFICYKGNQPVGYILIHFPKENIEGGWLRSPEKTILIREILWLDQTAKQTIFNFLWSHRDQRKYIAGWFSENEIIIDLLKTPRIKERKVVGNSLLRVINVKTVLENLDYPWYNFSVIFQIHDKFCPWNNGFFTLNSSDQIVEVEFKELLEKPADVEIDISYFSQLIAGFRTINELLAFDFVSIKREKLELLRNIFPKANNYFINFF
ncbi:MAG: enhanced intracellular survival protein Eis [Promethearchaeota archaeon]